jgi:hypothetical protein
MNHHRRDVLKGIGVAAVAIVAAKAVPAIAESVLGIAPGARFAECTLVRVEAEVAGAVTMVFADSRGHTFDVEALRFDARMPGVARAGSLALYLRNGGGGTTPTDEEHGLAVMALASAIAQREDAGMRVPVLATMSERRRV